MSAINTGGDGTIFINCARSIGKWLNSRKMVPGGAINTAKDGTIFINCLKPAGKVLNYLKGKGIPPSVTVLVVLVTVSASITFYCCKSHKKNAFEQT